MAPLQLARSELVQAVSRCLCNAGDTPPLAMDD
jgi:hypothetical protein